MASPMPHFLLATVLVVLGCYAGSAFGSVLFSSLKETLIVTASPTPGQVLKVGEDRITVTWRLNQSLPSGADAQYKKVKVRLCYAPASQVDRAWRKTNDELDRDKTCQFGVALEPYDPAAAKKGQSVEYLVDKEVPTATYFVRAYVLDASGTQVAYGQTTDKKKATNLFNVQGISGKHASLDVAAACFSAFSVLSLAGFFFYEKRKNRK